MFHLPILGLDWMKLSLIPRQSDQNFKFTADVCLLQDFAMSNDVEWVSLILLQFAKLQHGDKTLSSVSWNPSLRESRLANTRHVN